MVRAVPEGARRHRRPLTDNRIFKQRNVDIGVVSLKTMLGLGLLRRDGARLGRCLGPAPSQPYECYSELDFDIPVGKNGDCYDRYLIRMEEMRQSVKIMQQCIAQLNAPKARGRSSSRTARSCRPSAPR
jgi:NADH-quinone oxidoreductase subunit D